MRCHDTMKYQNSKWKFKWSRYFDCQLDGLISHDIFKYQETSKYPTLCCCIAEYQNIKNNLTFWYDYQSHLWSQNELVDIIILYLDCILVFIWHSLYKRSQLTLNIVGSSYYFEKCHENIRQKHQHSVQVMNHLYQVRYFSSLSGTLGQSWQLHQNRENNNFTCT